MQGAKNEKTPWYTLLIKYRELGLIGIIVLLVAVVSLRNPLFFTGSKMLFIVEDTATMAILAFGMLCVMLVGSIDISIAGIMALSAMISGMVMRSSLVATEITQLVDGVEKTVTVKTGLALIWIVLIGMGVGAACALVLIFVLRPLMKKDDPRINRILLGIMFALSLAFALFVSLTAFPADVDAENLGEAVKNAYTLLGCSAGLLIVHEMDARVIHFDTHAVWWAQIIKAVLGLGLVLALRVGLKPVLAAVLGDSGWAGAIRYFLMVLFAGCVWPLTFKLFGRLGQNGAAR